MFHFFTMPAPNLPSGVSRSALIMTGLAGMALYMLPAPRSFAQDARTLETECLVLMLDEASVAAKRDGLVKTVGARLGDEVAEGDLLFAQDTEQADASFTAADAAFAQAQISAENIWIVRAAEAELEKSTKEETMLREAGRTPFLELFRATQTVEKNAAELRSEELKHSESQEQLRAKQAERTLANLNVLDRRVESPFAGTIVKQLKYAGEWAQTGEPVVKILRMDRLMLQGIVNVRDVAPHKIPGASLKAEFQFAGEAPIVFDELVVEKSAPEVDLDGNYVIWTSVTNERRKDFRGEEQWLLRPGLTGRFVITLPEIQPAGEVEEHSITNE